MNKNKLRKFYYFFMGIFCIGINAIISFTIFAAYNLYNWKGGVIFSIIIIVSIVSYIIYNVIYDKLSH